MLIGKDVNEIPSTAFITKPVIAITIFQIGSKSQKFSKELHHYVSMIIWRRG